MKYLQIIQIHFHFISRSPDNLKKKKEKRLTETKKKGGT